MGLFTKKQQPLPRRRATISARDLDEQSPQRSTFQRNRTLTGSLVPGVKGAGERHADLRSPRVQAHDLRHHRRRLSVILTIVIIFVVLLGYVIFQSIATPKVVVKNMVSTDAKKYEDGIQSYLNSHILERTRLTLNIDQLTKYLQANGLSEVESISPNMKFGGIGVTELSLTMREPVVSWTTGSKTLYVDTQGNSFERNYYTTPVVQVTDQTGIEVRDDQVLVSDRFIGFIGMVVGRLADQDHSVSQIILPASTTRQILVSLEGVPYPIKMTVDRPAGEQSEDAARSVRFLAAQGITPAEYLDVRVSGKAFYK